MVSNQAIYPFVIGDCISRPELDNYFDVGIARYGALDFVEQKDIVCIRKELKVSA